MILKKTFEHPMLGKSAEEAEKILCFKDEIIEHYKQYEEKQRIPDLLGKTVRVTPKQFPKIHLILNEIESRTAMNVPDVYVYDDFFYGVEAKGLTSPWIEMSSKTIEELSEKEITFLLTREIGCIHYGYQSLNVLIERTIKQLEMGILPISNETTLETIKSVCYRYTRLLTYSLDHLGYIVVDDITVATRSILSCVLNSPYLLDHVHVGEFIKQSENINRLNDIVHEFTKKDEEIPYAPHRIKRLISTSIKT